jgi:pyruvate dehydrogenase E2 component (dihydrolipoamide acetyltransferase)
VVPLPHLPKWTTQKADATAQPAETATTETSASENNGRVKASPLAKKLAAEKGIDIKKVSG